jgi:hypothetical protein
MEHLNKAWNTVPPSARQRWNKIAQQVPGKTALECLERWDKQGEELNKGINILR